MSHGDAVARVRRHDVLVAHVHRATRVDRRTELVHRLTVRDVEGLHLARAHQHERLAARSDGQGFALLLRSRELLRDSAVDKRYFDRLTTARIADRGRSGEDHAAAHRVDSYAGDLAPAFHEVVDLAHHAHGASHVPDLNSTALAAEHNVLRAIRQARPLEAGVHLTLVGVGVLDNSSLEELELAAAQGADVTTAVRREPRQLELVGGHFDVVYVLEYDRKMIEVQNLFYK